MKRLSPRQWQIAIRLAAGHSDKEIAASLGIAEQTVKNHLQVIRQKLEVDTTHIPARRLLTATGVTCTDPM